MYANVCIGQRLSTKHKEFYVVQYIFAAIIQASLAKDG